MSGDTVVIKTYHNQFLRCKPNGNRRLEQAPKQAAYWEQNFKIYKLTQNRKISEPTPISSGDAVTFKNPSYYSITAEGGGGKELYCNRKHSDKWETFRIFGYFPTEREFIHSMLLNSNSASFTRVPHVNRLKKDNAPVTNRSIGTKDLLIGIGFAFYIAKEVSQTITEKITERYVGEPFEKILDHLDPKKDGSSKITVNECKDLIKEALTEMKSNDVSIQSEGIGAQVRSKNPGPNHEPTGETIITDIPVDEITIRTGCVPFGGLL